jgi:hypothetical protein
MTNNFPDKQARELLDELETLPPGKLPDWNAKAQTLLTLAGIEQINYNSAREFEK